MAINNATVDPYTPDRGYYECHACGGRTKSTEGLAQCPDCGGAVQNIAVAREEGSRSGVDCSGERLRSPTTASALVVGTRRDRDPL
jgi:rRNA maturation protein Nop10